MDGQRFDKAYFDAGIPRVGTNCEKWDGMAARCGDPEMIPMWVADMDWPTPPFVAEALIRRVQNPLYGYTALPEDYWDTVIRLSRLEKMAVWRGPEKKRRNSCRPR